MKPHKIVECSCVDGFTGEFCEFKTEQDNLLLLVPNESWKYCSPDVTISKIFNDDGKLIERTVVNQHEITFDRTCSTMLNGEAIIFVYSVQTGESGDCSVEQMVRSKYLW